MNTKFFIVVVLSIVSMTNQAVRAQKPDFEDNGIFYNILSDSTVEVTYKEGSSSATRSRYKGIVNVPRSVSYNNKRYTVTKIGSAAFNQEYDYSQLASVTLPSSILIIGENAFRNWTTITNLSLPDSIYRIEEGAFANCRNIYELKLPKYLKYIGRNSFWDAKTLEYVELPEQLEYIGWGNFKYANIIVLHSLIPPTLEWVKNVDDAHPFDKNAEMQIYVNGTSVKVYREIWGELLKKSIFMPLPDIYFQGIPTIENYSKELAEKLNKIDNRKETITSIVFAKGVDSSLPEFQIKEGINPNCMYWFPANTIFNGVNIVDYDNLSSNKIVLRKDFPFGCAGLMNCNSIEFSYTPSVWADGQSGWEVITLPFEPTSIEASVSGSIVPITTNSKGNFWLRQYVGSSDDAVYFASTSDGVVKANTPYLIAFPGDKMGKGSLEGQTITFKAKNVTIPVTTIPSIQKNGYTFVGNYDKTADEGGGWTLNAEGSAFVWSETVGDKPFSGYFKGEAPVAGASALRMSFGQMDNTTGLEQNMAELIDCADEVVYTLDGRKVITKDLKPGLYIKNHKKMMVR